MSKDKNKLIQELSRADFNKSLNQRSAMKGSSNFQKQEKLRLQGEEDTAKADKLERARLAGGAGGAGGMTAMDRYTQSLQKLLRGGGYRKPFDDLTAQLGNMATQAQGTIGSSMDQLSSFLQAQKNPFEGLTAQQTAVQPDLANLLQSQGVSTDPLQQYANTVNTQNAGQATAMQNLMNTLGGIQGANQAGALADVETNRANLQSQLGANQMGMGAMIGQQAMGQQQNLMQMLLEALSRGGRARSGRLF